MTITISIKNKYITLKYYINNQKMNFNNINDWINIIVYYKNQEYSDYIIWNIKNQMYVFFFLLNDILKITI